MGFRRLIVIAIVSLWAGLSVGPASAGSGTATGMDNETSINAVGMVVAEPEILSAQEGVVIRVEVMTQGTKKAIQTGTAVSQEAGEKIQALLRQGNLYEFQLNQQGDVVVAKEPLGTFRTLYSRGKAKDPLNWIADSAFVFDTKDYGMELDNGLLTAAGWIMAKTGNTITVGDGSTFSETYAVSPGVKVYAIDGGDYARSSISSFEAVQSSIPEKRTQAYVIFDRTYRESKEAQVVELYYFAADVPMPATSKERYIMNAPWQWGHEPFNLLGDVYCVGDKQVEIYLFNTEKGTVLLDTGWPNSAYQYFINIKKLGFDPRKIDYILLSHAHMDHYGALKEFARMNPVAKVLMSAEDYPYLLEQKADVRIDGFFQYGKELDFGNIKLKPILTPGHTDGTVSFVFDIPYGGKRYTAGYMGGYGINTLTKEWLQNSDSGGIRQGGREQGLLRRLQFRDSLMRLQQNEEVDFVATQHLSQYPMLEKWRKRTAGVNPFVDLQAPDKSQFIKQLEIRVRDIDELILADGPKLEPLSDVGGYIVSEPKIIPGWGKEISHPDVDTPPNVYCVQVNILTDTDHRSTVYRTQEMASLQAAEEVKETLWLKAHVRFDLDDAGKIVLPAEVAHAFHKEGKG